MNPSTHMYISKTLPLQPQPHRALTHPHCLQILPNHHITTEGCQPTRLSLTRMGWQPAWSFAARSFYLTSRARRVGPASPDSGGLRPLTNIREIGPRLLSCGDEDVTLQMMFEEKSMQWTLTNRGKDLITFQLALSSLVKAPGSLTDGRAMLTRGTAFLNVDAFYSITNTPTGALLISRIKAGAAKQFSLN